MLSGTFRSLLILVALLSLAGCGKSKGSLKGKVTLNGEVLPYAQVSAYNDKGEMIGQSIAVNGQYEIGNLPPGPVTLTVQAHQPGGTPVGMPPMETPDGRPLPKAAMVEALKKLPEEHQKAIEKIKPVPPKYANAKDSDLKTTVGAGETSYDIEMTGKGEIPKSAPRQGQPGGGPPIPPR